MRRTWLVIWCLLLSCGPTKIVFGEITVREWNVFEIEMAANGELSNPYVEALPDGGDAFVRVIFSGIDGNAKGASFTITGFWDGGKVWRARFAPPASGLWSYESVSSDAGLNGIKGVIKCVEWTQPEKAANPVRRGFVRVCGTGKRPGRYFEYADGTPFLWVGDTWWNWTKRGISFSSFKKLADDRAEKGFTVGQLYIPYRAAREHVPGGTDGVPDLERLRRVDEMLAYANSKGITVWVHPWWSRKNINERVGAERMRRWWRYVIARFGAYNVIWTLAGEYNMHDYGGFGLQFWKELGRLVDQEDPYERIIGVHPTPPAWDGGADAPQWSTGEILHTERWLSYNQSQVGHGRWRNEMIPLVVAADYARTPPKPIVVTEPWYEFIKGNPSAEDIRFGAWSAILSGAAGHTYGGGHIWWAHVPEAPSSQGSWPLEESFQTDTLNYPGAVSIGYMARFLRAINWWELEPHPELLSQCPSRYCAAAVGREYVVYLRWGGAVKVDMRASSANDTFGYIWIDLAEGKERDSGAVSGGVVREFHTPEDYPGVLQYKDWLLHIVKKP